MPEKPEELLAKCWLHSHEEDTAIEMVFRPANYAFPPSRGRTGFDLHPDHCCMQIGIAPADGPEEQAATWEFKHKTLTISHPSAPKRVLKVVSVTADRLVVKR